MESTKIRQNERKNKKSDLCIYKLKLKKFILYNKNYADIARDV